MSLEDLKTSLPEFAKDIRLNLSSLRDVPSLTARQLWGTMLACAVATRNEEVLCAIRSEAADHLSSEEMAAAAAAATVMAMNNVYYRFTHLVDEPAYRTMPARLRMNVIGNPGIDRADFELFCLAVSAVNGCGACMSSHEKVVVEKGLTKEAVRDAVRIASVVSAAATARFAASLAPGS